MLYAAVAILWSLATGHATIHTTQTPGGRIQAVYIQTSPTKCIGFDFVETGPFGNEYGQTGGDCS